MTGQAQSLEPLDRRAGSSPPPLIYHRVRVRLASWCAGQRVGARRNSQRPTMVSALLVCTPAPSSSTLALYSHLFAAALRRTSRRPPGTISSQIRSGPVVSTTNRELCVDVRDVGTDGRWQTLKK
eukprot:scaffold3202_cov117-Isochrysis_galbana.AAC.7